MTRHALTLILITIERILSPRRKLSRNGRNQFTRERRNSTSASSITSINRLSTHMTRRDTDISLVTIDAQYNFHYDYLYCWID
jgi:hypothetical protein